ncbi:hypothetical protein J1N35_029648 [Gossypium stocksii]|uniref:FMN-dependent dehydrogenase domain-containing protein n=1 Tax=Gossypium stocksii TaxID=47602 RepID=A0A9D3UYB8_9ROSI|nr:hypothetical protein J1N35_029648 [Gossypium stocksii]
MEITNVTEYEAIAKEKLPKMVYDYYASGAEGQWTLKENQNAFSRILHYLRGRATSSVEEVASAGPGIRFFQLHNRYVIHLPSYVGPISYSSTYYNLGDYQTAGGYPSNSYTH